MSPSEIDDSIEAGADLLLKGWKMLSKACPTCFQPLYERQGKVVCVKCKKDYVLVDSASEMPSNKKNHTTPVAPPSESVVSFDFTNLPPTLVNTANVMLEKINKLNARLNDATDSKEIAELSNAINSLVNSLRSLAS